jgi:hypothetical protein
MFTCNQKPICIIYKLYRNSQDNEQVEEYNYKGSNNTKKGINLCLTFEFCDSLTKLDHKTKIKKQRIQLGGT